MKTSHTPGTWHAHDGQIYPEETGKTLALIPYFDAENKEQEANAKLIAAAPELLDACISTLQSLDQMVLDSTMRGFYIVLKDAVKAAGVDFDTLSE